MRTCGYGDVRGILGANCRHHYYPFIEGVSERTYTDEQLEAMKAENGKFEYEGKTYDRYTATQKQREIEREIRKCIRREAAYKAAGLDDKITVTKIRLDTLRRKYRGFSAAAGLPEQWERAKVRYE